MATWIEHRAYWWLDENGGYQVGRPLLIDGEIQYRTIVTNPATEYCPLQSFCEIAMQPSHAGMPTWVPVDKLQPYPLEPIEEPSVKGGE